MFEYFPTNYVWNLAMMGAVNGGGAIGEIDEACRPLKEAALRSDVYAQSAWYESWKKVGERVEALGRAHEEAGQLLSAGRKYHRAALYYIAAERVLSFRDPRKLQVYRQMLGVFKKALQFRKDPVEWIEVPFPGKSLPGLFSKAPVPGKAPCMIHFDGFDVMKEIIYFRAADEFRRRGISLLIVDHPGVGEALRLRNMHATPDTEIYAGACVDYLERRPDVDPQRIGIMALSLGGYYAPRAAAFEKRLKCCVAWGALYDFGELLIKSMSGRGGEHSVPGVADHTLWVFGKETMEEALEVAKQMTLKGVAEKITCPLFIVHGENDRQVPLSHAQRTYEEAVNSTRRVLKVCMLAEGGAEHCQADNSTMAIDYMGDWVAEILGGNPKGV